MDPRELEMEVQSLWEAGAFDQQQDQSWEELQAQQGQSPEPGELAGRQGYYRQLNNMLNAVPESAAAFNRAVTGAVDMVPEGINAGLRLAGSDKQLPTIRGSQFMQDRGIEGGFMEPGAGRDLAQAAGTGAAMFMGAKSVPRNLASPKGAAAEWMGMGSAATPSVAAGAALDAVNPSQLPDMPVTPSKATRREMEVRRGSSDAVRAGYKIDDVGRMVPDEAQKEALSVLPPDIVAQVVSANDVAPGNKKVMREMMDIVKRGLTNRYVKDWETPRAALGEAFMKRYKVMRDLLQEYGPQVKKAKNGLRGLDVPRDQAEQPFKQFINRLANDYNIGFARGDDGALEIIFEGSEFQDTKGAQRLLTNIIKRIEKMDGDEPINAYDLHIFKASTLDSVINWKPGQAPLPRGAEKLESVVKELRGNINGLLGEVSPEYGKANEAYSAIVDLVGSADKLTGKGQGTNAKTLGLASRKALSNMQTSDQMEGLLVEMDEAADQFGKIKFDDSLKDLVSFNATLEDFFQTGRRHAFRQEIGSAVRGSDVNEARRAASGSTEDMINIGIRGATKLVGMDDYARRARAERKAVQAFEKLLAE